MQKNIKVLLVDDKTVEKAEKKAEQVQKALRQSEARMRAIFENTLDAIFLIDEWGKIKMVNQAVVKMFGYARKKIVSQNILLCVPDFCHCPDPQALANCLLNTQGEWFNKEQKNLGKRNNGELFPIELLLSKIKNRDKNRFVLSIRDITLRERAGLQQKMLQQLLLMVLKEESLDNILNFICQQMVSIYQLELAWIGFKHHPDKVQIAASAGSAQNYLLKLILHWDEEPYNITPSRMAIQSGQMQIFHTQSEKFKQWAVEIQKYHITNVIAIPLTVQDETLGVVSLYSHREDFFNTNNCLQWENLVGQIAVAIKEAFDRQEVHLLTKGLESTANAIVITDVNGNIQWVNPAFTKYTGYSEVEVLGQNPRLLNAGKQSKEFYAQMWQTILAGKDWQGEVVNRRKDGSFYVEEMNITPLTNDQGELISFIAIKQDITERKNAVLQVEEAKSRVERAERLASLGTMAAGIAHEINQPLNSLKVLADGMLYWHKRGRKADLGKTMKNIERISEQAVRIDNIIKHMRSFVRTDNVTTTNCDFNQAIEDALLMIQTQLKNHGIKLTKKLSPDLPKVLGMQSRLEEVVINLLVNAMQALDQVDQLDKEIICTTFTEENVILEISDNGPGIAKEIQTKIFEPFYTTKEAGKGMGLGLSIVHTVITSFHGQIYTFNNKQGGATFRIELPLVGVE